MNENDRSDWDRERLEAENETLRSRLEEAEHTLDAIRSGEVDALVIGEQVYTLESADAASNRFRGEALAQINDVVVSVDNDFRITYVNPAAERQYKLAASKILGHPLTELYEFRWASPEIEAEANAALESVGHWMGENTHVLPTGEEIWVESSVSRLRDGEGSPVGYLAVIRDIGERKRAEEALRQAHQELEFRVQERTKELADANADLKREIEERATAERQRSELLKRVVTVQEEERRRIALEIHDQLGQRVTALRFQIAALLNEVQPNSPRLETLDETAVKLDDEVSFLTWQLRPRSLDDMGLAEAVRNFLDDWERHYGISVALNTRAFDRESLTSESETHLYRILQEALNNILKHANARNVSVILGCAPEGIRMVVEDDGDGFEPDKAAVVPRGLGLVGMKERAILLGGDVEIESAKGVGTSICVTIPLAKRSAGRSG